MLNSTASARPAPALAFALLCTRAAPSLDPRRRADGFVSSAGALLYGGLRPPDWLGNTTLVGQVVPQGHTTTAERAAADFAAFRATTPFGGDDDSRRIQTMLEARSRCARERAPAPQAAGHQRSCALTRPHDPDSRGRTQAHALTAARAPRQCLTSHGVYRLM